MSRKLRARFAKTGKVRFVSHRDVARIWERALRRAQLPIAYTEGFSPRPKLSFGLALSTGYESLGEYLDISLREDAPGADVSCEQLPTLLTPMLPVGMDVQVVVPLETGAVSLQQAVTSCTWHIELVGRSHRATVDAVDAALAASELVVTRERKGHEAVEDIRPGIVALRVSEPALHGASVEAELATQPRGLRPAELVRALDPALEASRVVRIHQWTQIGGARQEVIDFPPAATPARTQQARAS